MHTSFRTEARSAKKTAAALTKSGNLADLFWHNKYYSIFLWLLQGVQAFFARFFAKKRGFYRFTLNISYV